MNLSIQFWIDHKRLKAFIAACEKSATNPDRYVERCMDDLVEGVGQQVEEDEAPERHVEDTRPKRAERVQQRTEDEVSFEDDEPIKPIKRTIKKAVPSVPSHDVEEHNLADRFGAIVNKKYRLERENPDDPEIALLEKEAEEIKKALANRHDDE